MVSVGHYVNNAVYSPFGRASVLLLVPLLWAVSPASRANSESSRRCALYLLSKVHFAMGILVGSSYRKKLLSGGLCPVLNSLS